MKWASRAVTKTWLFCTALEKQAGATGMKENSISTALSSAMGLLRPTETGGVKKSHAKSCCWSLNDQSAISSGPTQYGCWVTWERRPNAPLLFSVPNLKALYGGGQNCLYLTEGETEAPKGSGICLWACRKWEPGLDNRTLASRV